MHDMYKLGPSARFVSAVAALTVLGIAPPVAGQAENELPGVAVDDGDHCPRSGQAIWRGRTALSIADMSSSCRIEFR